MASIGPLALGAKGCVERLHPTGKTTHYILCVAGAPSNHVRCASLRPGGRRLAVRTAMEHPIGALPRTPFASSRRSPQGETRDLRRKTASHILHVPFRRFPLLVANAVSQSPECLSCYMTQTANPVTLLASPLGEGGHEVAKGVQANWIHRGAPRPANPVRRHPAKSVRTRERMIMIRYGDVTAERRHYNTLRPIGRYRNPQRRRRCRPPERSEHNLPPSGGHNTYAPKARAPSVPIPISPAGPDSLLKRNHAKKAVRNGFAFLTASFITIHA